MNKSLVRIGRHVFDLGGVLNVKWKGPVLYVDFVDRRFQAFQGREAEIVWRALVASSVDLETGEVGVSEGQ